MTGALKNAALLKSVWGNKGGYALSRPASQIRLLEVFEAVDGPVAVLDCVADDGYCDRANFCECRGVWVNINQAIVAILSKYTIADLNKEARRSPQRAAHSTPSIWQLRRRPMVSPATSVQPVVKTINGKLLRLEKGDLTALPVDAFVFYAREDLKLGSGFGTAIESRGGGAVKKELEGIGHIGMGEAIITWRAT